MDRWYCIIADYADPLRTMYRVFRYYITDAGNYSFDLVATFPSRNEAAEYVASQER